MLVFILNWLELREKRLVLRFQNIPFINQTL